MIFGLDDLWVIGAYAGCILCVLFCVIYSLRSGKDSDTEEDSDE